MRRTYPAAIIAAIMTLVDARQRDAHVNFSTKEVTGYGGRYILGRSMDYQTLSVTFEPSASRKDEIAREIRRAQIRIAELKPLAAQRFDSKDAGVDLKRDRRDGYKSELEKLEAKLIELAAEDEAIDVGYRDDIDLVEMACDSFFTVLGGSEAESYGRMAALRDIVIDGGKDQVLSINLSDPDTFDDGKDGSTDALEEVDPDHAGHEGGEEGVAGEAEGAAIEPVESVADVSEESLDHPGVGASHEGDDTLATHDSYGQPIVHANKATEKGKHPKKDGK